MSRDLLELISLAASPLVVKLFAYLFWFVLILTVKDGLSRRA
jgi:hypothetical protein